MWLMVEGYLRWSNPSAAVMTVVMDLRARREGSEAALMSPR